jgi:oligopeptide transport system ATP-binding protein
MAETILSVRNLKQHFTTGIGRNKLVVKAVDDVSFDIQKGEVFGLVGESGCGKTTTGRTIIKLYEPTDGEVYFLGERISAGTIGLKKQIKEEKNKAAQTVRELKAEMAAELEGADASQKASIEQTYQEKIKAVELERDAVIKNLKRDIPKRKEDTAKDDRGILNKMQMIFQDPIASLNPRMTVKEIIAEGLRIAGESKEKVIQEKVNDVLETVGLLPEHASRYPHEFSGGQRQRIGIARALVVNPEFIIADEPISALDVSIQAQVINLLNDLRKDFGITILFFAHDLSVVKYFADRIGVMYYGKLVELASKDELFKNPLHPYTKSLLSAVPLPDPEYERGRQRVKYDPTVHDYSSDLPELHEIKKGHLIYANQAEIAAYKQELK